MEEAKETLRALVERIVLTPSVEGAGLDLPLEGDLAGLLRLAAGAEGTNTNKAPDGSSETFDKNDELGILAGAGKRRILPALAGLRSRYPDIELELHADDSKSDFTAEAIDLSFRTGLADKERFISAAVPSAQRAPFASPAFAEKSPCLSRPADLARLPCVLRTQESGTSAFRNKEGQQEIIEPTIGLRVNSMELVFAAVLAGQGTALLPSLLTEVHILAHLIPNWSAEPVSLTLLCRPERLAAPQVAAVRRHILDACGNSDFLGTELRDEKVLQLTKARFGTVAIWPASLKVSQ